MMRKYSNAKIYRNLRVVKILSAISLVVSTLTIIVYFVIKFTKFPDSGIGEGLIFCCIFAILVPTNHLILSIRGIKTANKNRKAIDSTLLVGRFANETKFNNDFINTLKWSNNRTSNAWKMK